MMPWHGLCVETVGVRRAARVWSQRMRAYKTYTNKERGRQLERVGTRIAGAVWLLLVIGLVVGLVVGIASTAQGALVRDRDTEANAPRLVFGRIAAAWEAGDQQALTSIIHAGGLTVNSGRKTEGGSHYSPSQAFYYFRNIFRAHRTLLLEFEMMQDASAGSRVHGVAVWKRRRPDSTEIEMIKLVFVLVRQGARWQLAEINTIR